MRNEDHETAFKEYRAQRYFDEQGDEQYFSLTDLFGSVSTKDKRIALSHRFPKLLPETVEQARLLEQGKSPAVDDWLAAQILNRRNSVVLLDGNFPRPLIPYIEDIIGPCRKIDGVQYTGDFVEDINDLDERDRDPHKQTYYFMRGTPTNAIRMRFSNAAFQGTGIRIVSFLFERGQEDLFKDHVRRIPPILDWMAQDDKIAGIQVGHNIFQTFPKLSDMEDWNERQNKLMAALRSIEQHRSVA
ncbi:MAG: hypothetical protein RBR86_02890 [Pseudobdellovibrionaceae bacterium]|jgi:hypothetical protein|nr:hypothetical protein [Pseudobdellovibrionaceae bacterium]